MHLSFWEPLRQLDEFERVVDGLFQPMARRHEGNGRGTWRPAVEFVAEPERYRLRVDLPGVRKEDIDISVENEVLTVRGTRATTTHDGERKVLARETPAGTFERSFRLPEDAEDSELKAAHTDGVLEVVIAKRKAVQPRKIEIANA